MSELPMSEQGPGGISTLPLGDKQAFFQALSQILQKYQNASSMPPTAPAAPSVPRSPVISPERVPIPQGGTPIPVTRFQPQSIFQPSTYQPMPQVEFATRQGRNAAVVQSALTNMTAAINAIRQKKAQARANEAEMYWNLFLDAYERQDRAMMDAIISNPKAQKALEKSYGMSLDQFKKKPPQPEEIGASRAIQKHVAKQASSGSMPYPTPDVFTQAKAEQAKTQIKANQAMQGQLQDPQTAAVVGRQMLTGSPLSPAEALQAAEYQAGIKISPALKAQLGVAGQAALYKFLGTAAKIASDEKIAREANITKIKAARITAGAHVEAAGKSFLIGEYVTKLRDAVSGGNLKDVFRIGTSLMNGITNQAKAEFGHDNAQAATLMKWASDIANDLLPLYEAAQSQPAMGALDQTLGAIGIGGSKNNPSK